MIVISLGNIDRSSITSAGSSIFTNFSFATRWTKPPVVMRTTMSLSNSEVTALDIDSISNEFHCTKDSKVQITGHLIMWFSISDGIISVTTICKIVCWTWASFSSSSNIDIISLNNYSSPRLPRCERKVVQEEPNGTTLEGDMIVTNRCIYILDVIKIFFFCLNSI